MRPLLATLILLGACAQPPTDDAEGFDVTATPDPSPAVAGADVTWTVEITDSETGDAVEGATVTVSPWMPSMGHGIAEDPEVTEAGDGLYDATFLVPMSGTWELRVHTVVAGAEEDDVVTVEIE